MNERAQNIRRFAKTLIRISFILATIIIFGFALNKNPVFIIIGSFCVCFALIANLLSFITVLLLSIKYRENRIENLISVGLILINLPAAMLYFLLTMNLVESC